MSSCSSEVDVIKTRISTCDDENGVLYAYEPNTAYVNRRRAQSGTSYEEQQKTIVDVLSHCQVIQDAIENLAKKFDIINGKVSKIYRFRAKLIWQNRRPLGYAYKHYTYLLSRKVKLQKMKKRDMTFPSSLSRSQSYSPTTPVKRPTDSQGNPLETYYQSNDSPVGALYDDEDTRLSQSPTFPPYSQPYPSYYMNDPVQGSPPMPRYGSPGAHTTTNVVSDAPVSTSVPADMLGQGRSSPAHNSDMAYPKNENLGHIASSLRSPAGFAAGSSVGNDPGLLRHTYYADPADWSVEEVILFLKEADPQALIPLADLFREHEIDGKAMLLLHSDALIKHMGIKLGTALKLCHYIEKLKEEKCIVDI